jgi:hypothetical protein
MLEGKATWVLEVENVCEAHAISIIHATIFIHSLIGVIGRVVFSMGIKTYGDGAYMLPVA